jgi:hypothetical protein
LGRLADGNEPARFALKPGPESARVTAHKEDKMDGGRDE